jgi:NRPS condensation-like uncharacterized protein
MQDNDERADAFLKETLAYIWALDKGIRADARARALAQAIGAVHTLACSAGEAYAS